jgi:hypothetical protein
LTFFYFISYYADHSKNRHNDSQFSVALPQYSEYLLFFYLFSHKRKGDKGLMFWDFDTELYCIIENEKSGKLDLNLIAI